ncbi:oxidoreductase [Gordonia pseudamarae]|uniref:Oxidoreductase n=1 Tax=Gordonia pseudamarae TaxID=2831662 RepID=A0ABX6IG56_9ACTN|nr:MULTISPECIES: FAD-dependent oxidoreductase [Gordonia]MBD0023599.1 FAD-dependent oxidoreductase [Gordonia sp. (in: high G+C Gram-positive bacteria)]QHN25417.1 oxidoreductase [Gordonia pseudamarae]QHN34349.1 oxidoreductase [Gordonia pseudamarae]
MTRFIPSWLSGHRAVLLALLALTACALVVAATDDEFGYTPAQLLKSLVTVIVVCGAVTYLGAAIVRVPPNSDSWLITALILFFVMPVATDGATWKTAALGAAAAAASKYVLVWRRRLIINPVVVGAIVCYALMYADIGGLMYISWWVAAEPLLIPMLVIGALLVTALRVWELVGVYLAASVITLLVAGQFTTVPDAQMWLKSTPVLFLGAIMLPEPLTSPATRIPTLIYGALVGVLMHCQVTFEITSSYEFSFDPEIALAFGCLFAFAVRLANGSARRIRLSATTTPSADRTYVIDGDPAGGAPRFTPGQWATVSAPSWSLPLWRNSRRVFSYSSPADAVEFSFTTGPRPSPFKQRLIDARRTAFIDNQGGDFVVSPAAFADDRIVLIASGIGITPYISMLRTWLNTGADLSRVVLVHMVGDDSRRVYREVLDEAAARGARVVIIENPDASPKAIDRIVALSDELAADGPRPHFYISGAPAFVSATRSRLIGAHRDLLLRPWRIHTDAFTGY